MLAKTREYVLCRYFVNRRAVVSRRRPRKIISAPSGFSSLRLEYLPHIPSHQPDRPSQQLNTCSLYRRNVPLSHNSAPSAFYSYCHHCTAHHVNIRHANGGHNPRKGTYLPTYLSNLCKRKNIVEYMLIHSIMQLTASLNPSTLVIRNDSHLHAHHAAMAGSTSRETHFQYVPCTQHPNCVYTTHNYYTLHLRCCAIPLEWY